MPAVVEQTRLAELLAALSLVTDLGMGHPPEEAARACLLATGLARAMGLDERQVSDIYYTTLLKYLGCTAYAHEEAALAGGDDIRLRSAGALVDFADPMKALSFFTSQVGRGRTHLARAGLIMGVLVAGQRGSDELAASHCEVASVTAGRLGLTAEVQQGVAQVMERWDGKGEPRRLSGEGISLAARFALFASRAVIFRRLGGSQATIAMLRQWSGKLLDPQIVAGFESHGQRLLPEIETADACRAAVDAEPEPQSWIAEDRLDEIAAAFGDLVDLKVHFLRGHSRGVANLAEAAAARLGCSAKEVTLVRRSALFHDLGRVSVANGVWEKRGELTRGEWEQVRLHAYHSERILACSESLAPLAVIAGTHHERLDGSGYHRAAVAGELRLPARLLAVADAYQAVTSERPYRRAVEPAEAADLISAESRRGRLDGEVVQAVLEVAGQAKSGGASRTRPAGLTDREVQVLRLIARGASNKRVAKELEITPKTAGHHVQHIYDKIGASTRAAAALFAMERGLL